MNQPATETTYITTGEVVAKLERKGVIISRRTVQLWCERGICDAIRIGYKWHVDYESLPKPETKSAKSRP